MNIKVFIISHGKMAEGIHNSVEMIAGPQKNLYSFGLIDEVTPQIIIEKIRTKTEVGDFVIVLADLVGGSVCNEAIKLLNKTNYMLIGGINLPFVIELMTSKVNERDDVLEILEKSKKMFTEVTLPESEVIDDMSDFLTN